MNFSENWYTSSHWHKNNTGKVSWTSEVWFKRYEKVLHRHRQTTRSGPPHSHRRKLFVGDKNCRDWKQKHSEKWPMLMTFFLTAIAAITGNQTHKKRARPSYKISPACAYAHTRKQTEYFATPFLNLWNGFLIAVVEQPANEQNTIPRQPRKRVTANAFGGRVGIL